MPKSAFGELAGSARKPLPALPYESTALVASSCDKPQDNLCPASLHCGQRARTLQATLGSQGGRYVL